MFDARPILRLADIDVDATTGEPDWTLLRSFADQITLHPEWTAIAIVDTPSSGSSFMSNLLAAIAEKLADEAGIRRPGWTKQVAALKSPKRSKHSSSRWRPNSTSSSR